MNNNQQDFIEFKMKGEVQISSRLNGKVKKINYGKNAMHPRNMSLIVARALSNSNNGNLYSIKFGSGGANISASQVVSFNSPNVSSDSANLYTSIHTEVIKGNSETTPEENSIFFSRPSEGAETYIVITAVISSNELNVASSNGQPINELGLFSEDGLLLSHYIFPPIFKIPNEELIITYLITVSLA